MIFVWTTDTDEWGILLQVVANKSFNPEILLPDLLGKNSVLTVGNGFHGCILEGPSLVLEPSNLLQSVNVAWGPCPLKSPGCKFNFFLQKVNK